MKLSAKNLGVLIRLVLLFTVILTLAWALIERLLGLAGAEVDLSVGPIGFDVKVLAVWIEVNPGTFLGIIPGILVFRKL